MTGTGFDLLRRPAPPQLSGVVTEFMLYREKFHGVMHQREHAKLDVPLLIGFADAFAIGLGRKPRGNERYVSFLSGLFCGPIEIFSAGSCHCLQINFTPWGAHRFFGVPMEELVGVMADPAALLGKEFNRLRERLGNEPDWAKRLDIAEAFVMRKVRDTEHRPTTALWAFKRLARSGGTLRTEALAREVGWSRKHLNHMFRQEFGLGPKAIGRVIRFNAALAMAQSAAHPAWADIAYACGYCDQSHLARDFAALAGEAPAAMLR
jgi:AraC-like DNA-binding protein